MKVAAGLTPRPDDRPNKRERRCCRQLRGRIENSESGLRQVQRDWEKARLILAEALR